jgi:hypothetical protein
MVYKTYKSFIQICTAVYFYHFKTLFSLYQKVQLAHIQTVQNLSSHGGEY